MGFKRPVGAIIACMVAFALGVAFWAALDRSLWATAIASGVFAVFAVSSLIPIEALRGLVHSPKTSSENRHSSEAQRRWLAHVVDVVPTALVSCSGDGRLLALNRSSRALFATDGPIVGAPVEFTRLCQGPLVADGTPLYLGSPHPRAYAALVAETIYDEGPARLVALADIEELLQARAIATLKDTLDVLSHEIMNSLTPVTSLAQSAQLLLADGDFGGADSALSVLERRASGLLRFVESYRDLARLPAPVMRSLDVAALMDDVKRLFNGHDQSAGVALDTSPAPEATVMGDPDLLVQALINLLLNAAHAAQTCTFRSEPARVRLSITASEGRIRFDVSDNGPGLGALDPEAILKPFFTTRKGGAGIGLSLVYQIVSSHDSHLEFENSKLAESGLTVAFSLPMA
jgi:nitrogen fixation/metabolism regulation signal transduction histidine kinase